MNQKNLNKLITESLAIEEKDAKDANALGYMARVLVQANMPHRNPGLVEAWGRRNGNFSMVMQPGYAIDENNKPFSIGLPYGTKPRLVMAFVSSEAVRTRSRVVVLGRSLSEFMNQLNLVPTGGRWGNINGLKTQMKRLFSASVSFQYDGKTEELSGGFKIANQVLLFWDTKSPNQSAFWESTVNLTQEFYDEIINRPIPLDMRALSALKSSSLAIDIYCWLTYRMSYLKRPIEINWNVLAMQFGADYTEVRDFKKNFIKQLRKVLAVYNVKVSQGKNGLLIRPSSSHIPTIKNC